MNITRDKKNGILWIDQEDYVQKILKKFKMQDCKPVSTPLDPNTKLDRLPLSQSTKDLEEINNIPYQEAVGSLIYLLVISRPDISYAANSISRYNKNFSKAHLSIVKRIFGYLKGTKETKLQFHQNGNKTIETFSDADWANDSSDRKSISGSCFKLQGGLIS